MYYTYYIGQCCAILAWFMLLFSYHTKRESSVIFFQLLSALLYLINYYFLGAFTGFWISLFELIKAIGYYKTDKDKYIFFGTLPIYAVIVYFNGINILSIFAALGSIIAGYVLLKSKKTMVIGGIISYTLWIVYDLCFLDFAGATSDFFVVLSNLTILIKGYTKYLNRSNIYTLKVLNVSKNTIHTISKLDSDNYDRAYRWEESKLLELTKEQKYSYILVKDSNSIIGYICFINLKEDIYNKMINSNEIYDTFNIYDLESVTRNRKMYININSIVLNDIYNNSYTIKKMEDAIERYIKNMRKNKYYIHELCCMAVNPLENKILTDLNFEKVKNITNECILYRKVISS